MKKPNLSAVAILDTRIFLISSNFSFHNLFSKCRNQLKLICTQICLLPTNRHIESLSRRTKYFWMWLLDKKAVLSLPNDGSTVLVVVTTKEFQILTTTKLSCCLGPGWVVTAAASQLSPAAAAAGFCSGLLLLSRIHCAGAPNPPSPDLPLLPIRILAIWSSDTQGPCI